jgi:hypothetical protein
MKKSIILFSALAILFFSCKKWLGDNTDKATPQQGPAHVLLPPMFAQMERGVAGDARYIGRYIQNWGLNSTNDIVERHGYLRNSDALGEIWRTTYYGIGANINLMLDDAIAGQKWEFVGAGLALRAWCWQVATDYHGEIILKQAFDDSRYVFDYDTQDTVYAEVVRLCNQAIEYFNKTEGILGASSFFPTGDLVYKGNVDRWKKFVYGILARNAGNLSNKSIYNPQAVIDFVDKSLASNADNFVIPNGTGGVTQDNSNNYGPAKIPSTYPSLSGSYVQGDMIAKLMNGTIFNGVADPRAPIILVASPDGQFRGVRPAAGDPNRNTSAGIINPTEIPNIYGIKSATTPAVGTGRFIFKDDAGFTVMNYAEMQFIKAEAAFRKGDKIVAYDAFKKGITAHMDWTGVAAADRNTYLASAAVPQTDAGLTLKDIMLQKYIAQWGIGILETWNDMRRYHYDTAVYNGYTLLPDASYSTGTLYEDNNGKFAYRERPRYNSEYLWNVEALKKIGADKIDYHTYEPWFIKP